MWLEHHVVKKSYYKFRNVKFFKDLYLILILQKSKKSTLFRENNLNRELIYLLSTTLSGNTKLSKFHNKMVHNVLFLNGKLFHFTICSSPLCSF